MSADREDGGDELARVSGDVEEFIDRARLRSLFAARDEAAESIREASIQEVELRRRHGESTRDARTIVDENIKSAVTAYALEAEPLLKNTTEGEEVWEDAGLKPVRIPSRPEAGWTGATSRTVYNVRDGLIDEARDVIRLPGVGHYVNAESPFRVKWTGFTDGSGSRGSDHATRTATAAIPRATSEDVFRTLNKLLADLGVGLEAEVDEDDEASYDYSDLI
jgi:hypothetical protein